MADHDPLCDLFGQCVGPAYGPHPMADGDSRGQCRACGLWCECALIERVEERTREKDSLIALAYAEERLVLTGRPNLSEDITAALWMAARKIREAGT